METKNYTLTDEEQTKLSEALEAENKHDFDKTVAAEKEENPVSGLPKVVMSASTVESTGETALGEVLNEIDDLDEDTIFAKFGKAISAANQESAITMKDLDYAINGGTLTIKDADKFSDETKNELLDLINQYATHKEEGVKFNQLPDEVKDKIINTTRVKVAPINTSVLNNVATEIIDEFYSYASINSATEEFTKQANALFVDAQNKIIPYMLEAEKNRDEAIKKALAEVDDYEGKQEIIDNFDAMSDAYSLKPLKENAHRIKVKPIELEKPSRVFEPIHFRYHKDPRYNIFTLTSALPVLSKQLFMNGKITKFDHEKMISAKKFLVVFAKYCADFRPNVPKEHAFMYYVLNNINLLITYKGEAYDKFAGPFLENVMEVVSNIKK